MLSINFPALFARLVSKPSVPHFEQLTQEEIRDLQRIRAELHLEWEKQRLRSLLHQRFML